MAEKKTSQIGATAEGAMFLRRLAGRSLETGAKKDPETAPTAPFNEMKDAYRALFVYGLLRGERLPPGKGQSFSTIYANIGMLIDNYDFASLLLSMGSEEDMAGACLYLSSRAGAWCTGVILNVDGGTVGALQIDLGSHL